MWVETPTNPTLKTVDIAAIVERAQGALVAVDNTFATPVNQRPLELGAGASVHSATKYLGGHSDTILGAVVVADEALHEQLRFIQLSLGAVPGPLDCFLVHRGLRTLHLRMDASRRSAEAVVAFLREAGVEHVFYPGYGGMVSFRHPDAVRIAARDEDLRARRVARRRGVADRGPAGDDPPVGRGLGGRGAARPRAPQLRHRGARGPGGGSPPGPRGLKLYFLTFTAWTAWSGWPFTVPREPRV